MVVVHRVPKMARPIPATNAPDAMSHTGATNASANSGQAHVNGEIVATSSGRTGSQRSMTTPPRTEPAPSMARMSPHTGAPPSDSFAIAGPRTNIGAKMRMFTMENSSTMTHNHVRDQNSVHPCRSWRMKVSTRSEEHTSELQSLRHLVCRLLL